MANEKKNLKPSLSPNRNAVNIVVLIAAIMLLLLIGWIGTYSVITDRIIESSIQSMEELSKHDEQAIYSNLRSKWDVLWGVSDHIRQQKCETTEELLGEMSAYKQVVDCIHLMLVADNGTVISSNMTITENQELLTVCEQAGEHIIYRDSGLRTQTEGRGAVLVLGVRIRPFTVEGNTYSYLMARIDIDTLQGDLKLDSYESRGFSSVVDSEGDYIIKSDRNDTARKVENFYDEMREMSLDDGMTAGQIEEKIERKESFNVSYVRDGISYVTAFLPMEETDWYFILTVPRAVFEEQSMALLRIFALLMLGFFNVIVFIVIIIMWRRQRLQRLEQKHQQELADALELAKQASRAKTVFLNNMSHDIRTPMNAIIGFTTLALKHIDDQDKVKDYLGKITQSSNHLLSLINDVLDMSRIESGKMVVEERPENLAEILQELYDMVQSDVRAKRLELFIDTAGLRDKDIFCDRLRVNQILLNLLSNAIKFTDCGGKIFVKIMQTSVSNSDRVTYQFRVKDTGIGMSKEFTKMIFEPFARERTSTVSGIQGTGLGMSITKNLVDMMGGKIEVSSEVHKGTEFVVTLSFKLQQTGGKLPRKEEKETLSSETFQGKRLLLAEDNELNREIATELLTEAGFQVEAACDGQEAVDRIAKSEEGYFDAVLMDIQMPVLDGYEATRRIRKLENPKLAQIPIIAMTANAFEEDKQNAKAAGMNAHIGKPIDIPKLYETLKVVFQ